jgi:flavin-dependent dehydrogenase
MPQADVIVVGAGPAGASCALTLAQAGGARVGLRAGVSHRVQSI